MGTPVAVKDYSQQIANIPNVPSAVLHSHVHGMRTYPNPTQSLVDPVVFNKKVDCSREAMFGKLFHGGAAGKFIIATQPPFSHTPRSQYGGGKPSNNDSNMDPNGAPPAGLRTPRIAAKCIRAWQ